MQGPDPLPWDDVRIFLALARDGSLAKAGDRLGLDASTVSRRLAAIERRLALRLFDRTRDGMLATEAAERLLPSAETMETGALGFARDAEGFERAVEGRVRITAPPGFADAFLPRVLVALAERHPRLVVEVDARVAVVDLSRREADIALRTIRPRAGDLVQKRVFTTRTIPMGSPAYVASLGTLHDAADARWVGYGEELASLSSERWLAAHAPRERRALLTSSFTLQLATAEAGLGLVLAPAPYTRVFDLVPARLGRRLAATLDAIPEDELFLVGHRAQREVPRVAAVWRFLDEAFAEMAAELRRAPSAPRDPRAPRRR